MKKIYSSIDIGSDTIKFVVGEYFNNKVNILASHTIKSKGVRKGIITDVNLATEAVREITNIINSMLGINIHKVIVNVPSYNVKFIYVTGSIEIDNPEGIVSGEDVNRVIKNSVYNKLPSDYELITVVPLEFILDNNNKVNKPVGNKSKKLDLKGLMVAAPRKNILDIINVVEGSGLQVTDITLSGLADYNEIRDNKLDNKVGAIINIGHETTTVSIINNGMFIDTDTIPLGGNNVEKDIAYVFGVSLADARIIKERFASSNKRFCQISEVYEVLNTTGEKLKLNQLEVSEVVMNRLEEIFKYAKKKINELSKQNINYLVMTGGMTEIKYFEQLVFENLGKDVIIYTENTLGVRNNRYVTSLGMIKYFINKMSLRDKEVSMIDNDDEVNLLTPDRVDKKGSNLFKKFESFIASKEDKDE